MNFVSDSLPNPKPNISRFHPAAIGGPLFVPTLLRSPGNQCRMYRDVSIICGGCMRGVMLFVAGLVVALTVAVATGWLARS